VPNDDASLWNEFKSKNDEQVREALILKYAPLVKYIAGRVAVGMPPNVELEDLVSYGILGLMDAIQKFDPARNIKFETYAVSRIRGAIFDELRSQDWIPRLVRQRARRLEKVYAKLENELGRAATDGEVAKELGISVKEFHELIREVSSTALVSLDDLLRLSSDSDEVPLMGLVENTDAKSPETSLEENELKMLLAEAIDKLPEKERMVISLYYYEGLTLKETGAVLDVTESRASQLHTKAILRLRGRLSRVRKYFERSPTS